MNDFVIREASHRDAADMIHIHARSIRALCRHDYRPEQIEAWIGKRTPEQNIARIAARPFFVAEMDGKLIGYAAYNPDSSELLSVFVDPDFARKGVASAMVDVLMAHAKRNGMTTLWLDSSLTAVPFYEKIGFVGVMETTHSFGDVPLECLRMELTLKD